MFDFRLFHVTHHIETLDLSRHIAFGTALNRHAYLTWLSLDWLLGRDDRRPR